MTLFRTGDIVRREGDYSGRTRVVSFSHLDTDEKEYVTLNQMLDGWQVWNALDLDLVRREEPTAEVLAAGTAAA